MAIRVAPIHVVSTPGQGNPPPSLVSAPPNPPIPSIAPFPPSDEVAETLAIQTFNTGDGAIKLPDNQAIPPIIPGPNRPLPDASNIQPARIMMNNLPAILVMPSNPPQVSGPPGTTFNGPNIPILGS